MSHHIHTRFHVAWTFGVLGKLWLGYQIIKSTVNFESIAFNVTLILFFYKIFCCEAVKALPNPQNWLVWDLTVKDYLSGQVQIESMLGTIIAGSVTLLSFFANIINTSLLTLFLPYSNWILLLTKDLKLGLYLLKLSRLYGFPFVSCSVITYPYFYISVNISIRHFFTGMWVRTTSACD